MKETPQQRMIEDRLFVHLLHLWTNLLLGKPPHIVAKQSFIFIESSKRRSGSKLHCFRHRHTLDRTENCSSKKSSQFPVLSSQFSGHRSGVRVKSETVLLRTEN